MASIDVTAPKPRKSGLGAIIGWLRDLRARYAAERKALVRARAAHHAAILSAMTDDQLEDWGIKRENIHAHAFRNVKD